MNAAAVIQCRWQKKYARNQHKFMIRENFNENLVPCDAPKKNKKIVKERIDKKIAMAEKIKERKHLYHYMIPGVVPKRMRAFQKAAITPLVNALQKACNIFFGVLK